MSTAPPDRSDDDAPPSDPIDRLRAANRYVVLSQLGHGSVGRVERVFDLKLGRVVARKTLHASLRDDERVVRTFLNEAKITGHLDHGAVIPIFDAYVDDEGLPVYTMRVIHGKSLSGLISMDAKTGRATPIELDRTLKILTRIFEGLSYAHDRGVVHLDLKPHNIIVLEHDEVVLVDWGAARLFEPSKYAGDLEKRPEFARFAALEPEDEELFVGTPRYMSPEQTDQPRNRLTPASDVFSMGVIFYQMLTGRLPFQDGNLDDLLRAIRETDPPPARAVKPSIHPRLSSIVDRMLAKRAEDRYGSFEEVLGDLEEFRSTAAEFPERVFAAGERVFTEGDAGDVAYFIVEGGVEIATGEGAERQVLAQHEQGEAFGELAVLRDRPRSATATATSETRLRLVDRDALMSEVERLSPWIHAILEGVVERFVDRSDRLVELQRERDGDG